ncbi:BTAD domain-containing putative transcriptional regulator [Gordonia sp. (in: high G+C Gram-positive bacteria)]|uniref:BTAD domain-containing putative transcriptional regulator n=1 Tax=Gordonia sp. (in: high G+C Gram-positive bacteria) TaxID=84139 RepID=UPI0035270CDF
MTAATIGLLGPVTVDGTPVPGIRARRLLVSLVLAGGRVRSAQRLIDDVWDDAPPKSPHAALHTQISRLRRLLPPAEVVGDPAGYRLDGAVTDLALADDLLAAGTPEALARAQELWRGAPGDDLDGGELARELQVAAEGVRRRVDDRRAHLALTAGEFDVVRGLAETRCAADPLDEEAHLLLMRALSGQGRRAEALAVFAGLRRALATELGIDPGPEITALNTELLTGPPASKAPVAAPESPVRAVPRARASGLRAESTPLVGRDDDLTAVEALLAAHRVVTVQGPGGIGKTRFANAVGLRLAGRGDTAWFVPLASVRNDDDVAAALAGALGVGEADVSGSGRIRTTISEVTALLAEAVAGRRALIVLDNCEQVVDGAARIVDELVAVAPELTVLATSRAPLMIPAEQTYQLPVLATDGRAPAVELFLMRARAARPAAQLDRAAVARLCEYLDGLPLAIELAAARIRTMSVEEITERLAERFTLLRSTDRTVPDRHRTLHAVIEWSWELLTPDARRLLTRMCRFPGGFDRRAATQVSGLPPMALDDALTALVNQSLLQVIDDGAHVRYRMMEMVREFGEEQVAADPDRSAEIDVAMAAWARLLCERLREQFDRSVDRALVDSVASDVENLVWVLRGALAGPVVDTDTVVHVFPVLSALWSVRGLHAEIGSWGDRILRSLGGPPADLDEAARERWQLTVIAAAAPLLAQQSPRGLAIARSRLRHMYRPDLVLERPADFISGFAVARTGVDRIRLLERAPDHGGRDVRELALGLRTNIRENAGNLVGAMRDCVRLAGSGARDPWVHAMNQLSMGSLHSQQGDWAAAAPHFQTAIDELEQMGASDDSLQAQYFLTVALIATGELDRAEALLLSVCEFDPDMPLPQGDTEAIAAQAICWAALRHARGEDGAELYRGAAEVLLRDYRPDRADPGANVLLASAVCGLVQVGRADWAQEWLPTVARGLREALANPLWRDIPQLGSTCLAVGLLLVREPGAESDGVVLMEIGVRLRVRQDYPAVYDTLVRRREFAPVDARTWDAVARRTEQMSRRRAMEEAAEILDRRLRR